MANLSLGNRLAYDLAVDRYNVNRFVEEAFLQEAKEEANIFNSHAFHGSIYRRYFVCIASKKK